jgi:hypothetical protein
MFSINFFFIKTKVYLGVEYFFIVLMIKTFAENGNFKELKSCWSKSIWRWAVFGEILNFFQLLEYLFGFNLKAAMGFHK